MRGYPWLQAKPILAEDMRSLRGATTKTAATRRNVHDICQAKLKGLLAADTGTPLRAPRPRDRLEHQGRTDLEQRWKSWSIEQAEILLSRAEGSSMLKV